MYKKVLMLSTFFLATFLFTNTANANFLSSLLNSYSICGKITNHDLEPIAGAKVTIKPEGGLFSSNVTTDENGNFSASISKTGQVCVTITKKGYKTYHSYANIFPSNNVLDIILEPDKYPIGGKVTDSDGVPIQGVTISIEPDGGKNGVTTITTDENGVFTTGISVTGPVWVTITKDGYQTYRSHDFSVGRTNTWNFTLNYNDE